MHLSGVQRSLSLSSCPAVASSLGSVVPHLGVLLFPRCLCVPRVTPELSSTNTAMRSVQALYNIFAADAYSQSLKQLARALLLADEQHLRMLAAAWLSRGVLTVRS